jgi:hypothetical protein
MITMAITQAKIGRSMKKRDMLNSFGSAWPRRSGGAAVRAIATA